MKTSSWTTNSVCGPGPLHAGRKEDLNSKVIEILNRFPTAADVAYQPEDPIACLNSARRRFQQQQEGFEAWAKKEPSLCKAFQARNRGVRLAACGVRWHQAVLGCNINGESQYTARVENLRKLFASLQKLSPQLDTLMAGAKADVDPVRTKVLDGLTDEVNHHAKDLYESWQTEAQELARASVPASGRAARVDAILAIPVLDAKDRIALLKMRRTLDVPLVVPEKLPSREIPTDDLRARSAKHRPRRRSGRTGTGCGAAGSPFGKSRLASNQDGKC